MTRDRIDLTGFIFVLTLTILWGVNYLAIKVTNTGLSPIFTATLRSIIASVFGIAYCLIVRQPVFHKDIRLLHGLVVGLLFGAEFACIYLGMLYTNAGPRGRPDLYRPFCGRRRRPLFPQGEAQQDQDSEPGPRFPRRMPRADRQTCNPCRFDGPGGHARNRSRHFLGCHHDLYQEVSMPGASTLSTPSSTNSSSRFRSCLPRPICSSLSG